LETDSLPISSQSGIWDIHFQQINIYTSLALIAVFILLIISALVSIYDMAFCSVNASDKLQLKKSNKTDSWILQKLENQDKYLATIIVVNSFINIVIIVLLADIFKNLISIQNFPVTEFLIQFIVITFLLLIFDKVIPGVIVPRNRLKLLQIMTFPLLILEKILSPVIGLFFISNSFVRRRMQKNSTSFSINEISKALQLTSEQELSEEKEILEGIVKFGNKNVSEIMKPRVDVISLDIKTSFSSVLKLIVDSGFSRIPVYGSSFDNIKGILYIKDILPHSHKSDSFKWQSLVRPPFYVPETKKINSLLKEFQKNKVHLAVVIDEYGGTSGIVTLEDVLEEIVGDIVDEFDEEEHYYSKISANSFLFDGKTLLGDFFKITKCDDTVFNEIKGDADTLAGLILELKGEIPAQNETTIYKQFAFTIESVDNRRIKQIKVVIDRDKTMV
jgi:gliding motility-associated protein GldE